MDIDSLYKENFSKVQLFCQRWTANADDARDIAQEAFIELMHKQNGSNAVKSPIAWVFRVAYNRCVNRHRFNLRFSGALAKDYDCDPLSEEGQRNRLRLELIKKAMRKLTHKERALVTLYKMGFSYAEMASIVEMNPASVGKTLTRAIDKLSKWVKQ